MRGALVVAALAGGGLLLASRSTSKSTPTPQSPDEWLGARLTEFFPDAPEDQTVMEGGPHDWGGADLITLQQHRSNSVLYPWVSVSSDIVLRGRPVAYGTRIHFEAFPDDVFRLVDTGCNFSDLVAAVKNQDGKVRCKGKQVHLPGHEPFDIATSYAKRGGMSGRLTRYRLDSGDYLKPQRFHPYTRRPAVA